MGLFDKLFNIESPNFKTITKPTFIKDFSKENDNINELQNLLDRVNSEEKKELLSKEIAYMNSGLTGENNVYYELKNCTFPILSLHDIRLEHDGLTAQMDFVVITKKFICVLETKQLHGNVTINSNGEFIRTYKEKSGYETKVGMYSPVEQNRKHINLIKRIIEEKLGLSGIQMRSLIVMANPKAIIKKYYAPKEIQDVIIKAEKINDTLCQWMNEIENVALKEESAIKIANYLKDNHAPISIDYKAKFALTEADFIDDKHVTTNKPKEKEYESLDKEISKVEENNAPFVGPNKELAEALKLYRNTKAKEEGLEPFKYHFVFSSNTINEIVELEPKSLSELYKVKGLGDVKIKRYGEDILSIIKSHEGAANQSCSLDEVKKVASEEVLREKLKNYRLEASRKENVKAYIIFSNEQMEEIIRLKPVSKEGLLEVKGFGSVKVERYGDFIIEIVKGSVL